MRRIDPEFLFLLVLTVVMILLYRNIDRRIDNARPPADVPPELRDPHGPAPERSRERLRN